MSIEIKDIELIDRYLGGDLKGSELQAFQQRLQSDASFKELLSDFQATDELVKANELAQVQAQLNSFSYEAAPWWQSTAAKVLAVAGVAAVVTTAVWMSSSDDKPTAKETVAVAKTEPAKEQNNKVVIPSDEKPSPSLTPEERTIQIQSPADYNPVTPDLPAKQEENTAPLNPVTVPTGPAVPPQQAPAVPSTAQPKPAPQQTAPATPAKEAQEQPVIEPQPEVKKHFIVQIPGQNWEYPEHMRNGKLTIMNESGALIYEINNNASTESWNGTDRYGNMVPAGLYYYQYTDVSGKNYSGTVTVAY